MTRIVITRKSAVSTSSSGQNRSPTFVPEPSPSSAASTEQQHTSTAQVVPAVESDSLFEERKEEIVVDEISEDCGDLGSKGHAKNSAELSPASLNSDHHDGEKVEDGEKVLNDDDMCSEDFVDSVSELTEVVVEYEPIFKRLFHEAILSSHPPPSPSPLPTQTPFFWGYSSKGAEFDIPELIWSSKRPVGLLGVSSRSQSSSPPSPCMDEGYNSADERRPCTSSFFDKDREHRFEIDLKLNEGLDVKRMLGDGNCLFRAVADQVFGDPEKHKLVRQMCIDHIEANRDHFSNFITEDFTAYCKRKRMDKVYGNNAEIQALSDIFNQPIHIYSYSSDRINILHSTSNSDMPPIRLSYHDGNHYNSLVDPQQSAIVAGLGLNSLQAMNVDKDQVKAAMTAQEDQLIDNDLLAEVRRDSELEYTEKEIERTVIEASRAEYIGGDCRDSSTSLAKPSSSAADRTSRSDFEKEGDEDSALQQMLSMGFNHFQVAEAYSIFGDDVHLMVGYLVEKNSKGKAPLVE